MAQAGFTTRAIVVGVALVSTAMLVSTLAVFQATPPTPTVNCLEPKNGSSDEVVLFPQGYRISLTGEGFANSSFPTRFCLTQSVDIVGAWTSNQPGYPVVVFSWEWPILGCDPQFCGHRNGTLEGALFPGAYIMDFFAENSTNVTVNVTQSIELVFDRVTEMLQPSGPVYMSPGDFTDWTFSVPSDATNAGLDASDAQINVGYYAGLMNATQFATFQQNPSSQDFHGLPWGEWSNAGEWGSILVVGGLAPGNYTLVVWNYGSENGILQLDGPLYLAFNAS